MAEAQIWKAKYTTEAVARIEDLENARAKLLVMILTQIIGKVFFRNIANRLTRNLSKFSERLYAPRNADELLICFRRESTKPKSASRV